MTGVGTGARIEDAAVSPHVIESFDPARGDRLGEVPVAGVAEVEAAFGRARQAQKAWAALGARGRGRILGRLKSVLIDRADEIVRVVSAENGKPRCEAAAMVLPISATIDLCTRLALRAERGRRVSSTFFLGSRARVFYEPRGVAGFILPWNFPFELGVKHLIPALAAGNGAVQKPSEVNPLIGELIRRLFDEAGLPEGLVEVVHGYAATGEAIIDNADIVCFVGSPATGRKVMARAALRPVPVVLELGGNDAAIVRRDADLGLTARGLVNGTCFNSGQVCNGIERIYAPLDLVEALADRMVEIASRLRIGGPGPYDIGPITHPPQRRIYEAHTADALARGARLRLGGEAIVRGDAVFWAPTVLTGMTHEMLMMREETFGPFMPIVGVLSDDEAVRLANDSPYGLGGSVWTRDVRAGEALARRLNAGSVMVNNAVQAGGCVTLPFGGRGFSGVGCLQGEEGFANYLAPRSLMTCPRSVKDLWMPYGDRAEEMVGGLVRLFYGRGLRQRLGGAVTFLRSRPGS